MTSFATTYLSEKIEYTGRELSPHWVSEKRNAFGSALVAFCGPCFVATSELVDLEDSRAGAVIRAREMLHFLGESFSESLELAIARQRLFAAIVLDALRKAAPEGVKPRLSREGDDIFWDTDSGRKKMSVSIVTSSPVSTLFHFALNVDADGAPVPAAGLNDMGLDPEAFARQILALWADEIAAQEIARAKVLPR